MSTLQSLKARVPHLDQAWVDECIVELRLRGASGAAIGAALLEADSHMAEHGGDVADTFGPARVYAALLDLPDTQQFTPRELALMAIRSGLSTLACWLTLFGLFAAISGSDARLSIVTAVVLVVGTVIAAVVFAKRSKELLRWSTEHRVASTVLAVLLALGVGLLASAGTLVPAIATDVPWPFALGGGLVLLAAVIAWWLLDRRTGKAALDDDIEFPVG